MIRKEENICENSKIPFIFGRVEIKDIFIMG